MIEYIFVPNAVQSTKPADPAPVETVSTEQAVQQTTQAPNLPSSIAPPEAFSTPKTLPSASNAATSNRAVPAMPSPPAASHPATETAPVVSTAAASQILQTTGASDTETVSTGAEQPTSQVKQPTAANRASNGLEEPRSPALPETTTNRVAVRRQVIEQRLQEIVSRHRQRLAATTPQMAPLPAPTQTAMVRPTEAVTTINSLVGLPYSVEVLAIMRVIVQQESSGNHRAVNRHSGALGYAQVMPSNLPSWSQAALGRRISQREFLNQPGVQLQIIAHRLNQYWRSSLASSNGDEAIAVRKVASLWYSGRASLFDSNASQYYGGYRYPSIAEYTLKVLRRYLVEKQSLLASNWRLQGAF